MAQKIPPSLNNSPFTKTPFYLYLYGASTKESNKWRGWTREEVKSEGRCWALPLPEKSLGANTELKATDEESTLSYPGAAGSVTGMFRQLQSSLAGLIPVVGQLYNTGMDKLMGHGMGGAGVPLDYTAMTVYGTKKRSFRFIFDLYALDSSDSLSIANFCRIMHGSSMVGPGIRFLTTPYVWTVDIVNDKGDIVTENWLPDPGACCITSFSHSPSNFIYTHEGKAPGRSVLSLIMTEIEPMSYNGSGFVPTWSKDTTLVSQAFRGIGSATSTAN